MKQQTGLVPILELTASNFKQEVLDNSTPILVDFWAPWCGPCKAMKPILSDLATTLAGKVRIAQVNVDTERELAGAFEVRSIPTCMLLSGPNVLAVKVGLTSAKDLIQIINTKIVEAK